MASIKYHLKAYITEHVNIIYSTEQKKTQQISRSKHGEDKRHVISSMSKHGGDTSHHPPGIYAIAGSTVS